MCWFKKNPYAFIDDALIILQILGYECRMWQIVNTSGKCKYKKIKNNIGQSGYDMPIFKCTHGQLFQLNFKSKLFCCIWETHNTVSQQSYTLTGVMSLGIMHIPSYVNDIAIESSKFNK